MRDCVEHFVVRSFLRLPYNANYNETMDESNHISYVDYVEILTSSMTTIINIITYVLIAFVAVSLVVSSIMIGIITYI